ncbi:MAG: prepilin-type N-terminal cleavage/methylation domain-containing protein, partial [Candidatus Saccharibacteria bacterium]|nr:prepilin-type N-terminal cleavage/methylation domain-containing protein [Candidatus Saccharibacteria bacterium]
GFTLVELAIVLVIIGIIMGAVLRGQQMIEGAKLKRLYNQQREIAAAFYTYYDKYGKFPGDDNTVATRGGVWATSVNGDSDGLIEVTFAYSCSGAEATGAESCNAWSHLRLANIISGSGRTNPSHAHGGAVSAAYGTVNTVPANWIAFQNVPGDAALSIDTQYDDGVYNTGTIQGSAVYTGAVTDLYSKL